ncbi:trehalose-phosphatase [Novilysobacter erysipheiresistens]|uniref:Trehalose 6-phosphate phosphatase n=1 Tax=Novilysobacter erysipheiresistens TaxID=1749332 RepID=A0ABU7YYR1_9GAMM
MDAPAHLPPPPAIADDWALFLDVDGTLLAIAGTPDAVRVPPGLIDALASLQQRLDGALALVSGRRLAQLDALFAPLKLPAAGLHGLERRHADNHIDPPTPPSLLAVFHRKAELVAERYPGALVEDKDSTIALHWRGNPHAEQALRELSEAALPWLHDYRLQPGDGVIEVRPVGTDKGDAIAALLDEAPFAGRHAVFVGDDLTDEHGFEVVLDRGGMAVLVGNRQPSRARHRLHDPAAVLAWLAAGA